MIGEFSAYVFQHWLSVANIRAPSICEENDS